MPAPATTRTLIARTTRRGHVLDTFVCFTGQRLDGLAFELDGVRVESPVANTVWRAWEFDDAPEAA